MELFFIIIVLVFSVVIHEVAHGSVAYSLGDPTAKYANRLTLNPLNHLDPVGSFILPLFLVMIKSPFLIGWAKPVPINPYNFSDQRYGRLKVSLAGPLSNLSIALFFGVAARLMPLASMTKSLIINGLLLGERVAMGGALGQIFYLFLVIILINTILGVFNLIPVPPLDGSQILFSFFPSWEQKVLGLYSRIGFLGRILLFSLLINILPYLFGVAFFIFRLIIGA